MEETVTAPSRMEQVRRGAPLSLASRPGQQSFPRHSRLERAEVFDVGQRRPLTIAMQSGALLWERRARVARWPEQQSLSRRPRDRACWRTRWGGIRLPLRAPDRLHGRRRNEQRRHRPSLFVSVKTVEMHLGHVYQKLNLTRRTKLSAALGNRGTPVGRFSFELSAPAFTTLRRTLVGRLPAQHRIVARAVANLCAVLNHLSSRPPSQRRRRNRPTRPIRRCRWRRCCK